MKTSELTGAALDWAVTKAEGFDCEVTSSDWGMNGWATDWAQGGAIIERQRICLIDQGGDYWQAICGWKESFGDTPLEAAMRCHVVLQLGDEVDVPEELL